MRNGSVSRSEESIIRMTINVSLIMTADFARLGTFYHSPFIFRGNAIKRTEVNRFLMDISQTVSRFSKFSKNTLENFHIRIRYALVETSVQGDGFFAADFFHFFCPVGEEEAVFPCIFFYPLFAYEALYTWSVPWRWSWGWSGGGGLPVPSGWPLLFMCGQVGDDKRLAGGEPIFLHDGRLFQEHAFMCLPQIIRQPHLVAFFRSSGCKWICFFMDTTCLCLYKTHIRL